MEDTAEVYDTPFGDVLCGRCGAELECDDCCDEWPWPMPERCPECGAKLDYSYYEKEG